MKEAEKKLADKKLDLQLRDRVMKVISKDGKFRITILKNTKTVQTAQERHKLDYLPAFMLGRAMSAASLYASFLKGEERVVIETSGDGPLARVYAEAIHVGESRGFVVFAADSEEKKMDNLSDAIGEGTFKLTRILENRSEPLTGVISIHNGDIASEMTVYFVQSEQIPSYVLLPIEFDEETGLVTQSGGIIAQAMPGYSPEDLFKMLTLFDNMPNILKMYEDGKNPKQVLDEILPFEYDVIKSTMVDFYCRCSKDMFMQKLLTLGTKELEEMKQDGHNELVCQYCNEHYTLEDADFDSMIEETKAQRN